MPKPARLEKIFLRQKAPWSPFPPRPPRFHEAEWETKKHEGDIRRLSKAKPPCQIPPVTAPIKDWRIFRNDIVEICIGEDTGKQGKVRAVARKKNLLKIAGLNCSQAYMEDMGNGQPGFILNEEPIHYNDLKVVNPLTGRGTDVVWRYDELGEKVRVCKEHQNVIPVPPYERLDFKDRSLAKEGEFDTLSDAHQQHSYVPSLLLFHEEVMLDMQIPMSVSKTAPERRDLIIKEIEDDVKNHTQTDDVTSVDNENNPFIQYLKEKLFFWR